MQFSNKKKVSKLSNSRREFNASPMVTQVITGKSDRGNSRISNVLSSESIDRKKGKSMNGNHCKDTGKSISKVQILNCFLESGRVRESKIDRTHMCLLCVSVVCLPYDCGAPRTRRHRELSLLSLAVCHPPDGHLFDRTTTSGVFERTKLI